MVGPRILFFWPGSSGLTLEGSFLFPVHQNMTGLQLGVDNELLLGIRWTWS